MTRKNVEILDENTGKQRSRCRKCGEVWYPQIKPGTGEYYRGAWTCPKCGA